MVVLTVTIQREPTSNGDEGKDVFLLVNPTVSLMR
jgi:hypothetical protein